MSFFESIRRANADFYIANPVELLTDTQLAELAQQQGMTIEELKDYMTTPHVEITCPLCGQASTHLVQCKGCGGGAWGFEYESAHGEDAIARLQSGLDVTLRTKSQEQGIVWQDEQVSYAVKHVYQMGGCMVCADCWDHTLPYDAYQICPIYLHSERTVEGDRKIPFQSLLMALMNGEKASEWVKRIFIHWTLAWNTAYESEQERMAIAAWRSTILHGALGKPEEFITQSFDLQEELAQLLRILGMDGNL